MKKILMLLVSMLIIFYTADLVYAESVTPVQDKYNLLDLSQVIQSKSNPIYGHSDDVIEASGSDCFTLVMSYDFLDIYKEEILSSEFEYEIYETGQPFVGNYTDDTIHQMVYIEFTPLGDFTIFTLPTMINHEVPNYEIILYKGIYDEFKGFEPYLESDYIRTQYGDLTINYDYLFSQEEILSLISAYDSNHQLLSYEVINDTYTNSDKKPGDYEITLETSINDIYKYYLLSISVEDTTSPNIIGPSEIDMTYGETLALDDIISQYSVTDNVDTLDYHDIEIIGDTYSTATTIGSYTITMEVSDLSGNTKSEEISIFVLDQVPPTISGPETILLYTTDQPMTQIEILNKFSVYDDVDEIVNLTISSSTYNQTTSAGIYHIILSATDLNGNTQTKTVYMHVIENRGPSFEVSEPIVDVTTSEMMSANDVLRYMQNYYSQNDSEIENLSIVYNEYENHETEAGEYYVYFNYEIEGVDYTSRMKVNVLDEHQIIDYWYYGLLVIPLGILGAVFITKKKKKI